jgi:hypothetical protein
VTLVVNGNTYFGTVDASGNFSISVPGSDLAADTSVAASVNTTDTAGNTGTGSDTQTYTVDTVPPSVTIAVNDVTADNVLNAAEAGGNVTITGSTTGTKAGDTVSLVVNGNTYTGTVDASGNFSISVPGSDLVADSDTTIAASVSSTDAAGNTGTGTGNKPFTVNGAAPAPTITLNDVTLDNVLNAAEAGGNVTITGSTTGTQTGDTVNLVVNGQTFTATVDASGNFSISVPGSDLAADSDTTIAASVSTTNSAGNTGSGIDTQAYTVDTTAPALTISVNSVTTDNVVNAAEAGSNVTITGSTTGTQAGDTVTLTINGNTYTGTVDGSGNYSINVPGSDLIADSDTTIAASVSSTDVSGNTGTGTANKAYTIDTVAPALTIAVNSVTTDNILNAAEAGGTVAITGTTTGTQAGDTVTLTINGKTFTGTVDGSGNYSINVPGSDLAADSDTTIAASVSSTDTAGNTGTGTANKAYTVDTTAPAPTIAVNSVTPDNVLNAAEAGANVTITGTTTGTQAGDTVTLTINGKTYTGTVDGSGNYSINVPGSDLAADSDTTIAASVSSTDTAGNTGTGTANKAYTVDTVAPVVPTVVSQVTSNNTPTVTGTVTLGAGENLAVTINGVTYTTANGLSIAGPNWSVTLPSTPMGTYTVVATARDSAGNTSSDATANELVITGPITANPDFLPLPTNAPASLSLAIAKTNVTANDTMLPGTYMSAVRGTNGYAVQMRGDFVLLVRSSGLTMGPAFFYDLTYSNTNGVFTSTTLVTYTNDPVPVGINAGTATCLSISNVGANSFRLVFAGLPNKYYQIEKSHDLTNTNAWMKMTNRLANSNGYFDWTDTNATNNRAFYRSYHIQTP